MKSKSILTMLVFCLMSTMAWATEVSVYSHEGEDYVPLPVSGTYTVTVPDSILFFDVSSTYGEKGVYHGDLSITAPNGMHLQVYGKLKGRSLWDSLFVYDGSTTSSPMLLKMESGEGGRELDRQVVSSGESLTISYRERDWNRTVNKVGLDLKVRVINPKQSFEVSKDIEMMNGDVDIDASAAKLWTPVHVTATPEEGYFFNKIQVFGKTSREECEVSGGTWYSGNKATFLMPGEKARVDAYFVDRLTAENGLSIPMPKKEPLRVNIPEGVESFNIDPSQLYLGEYDESAPLILTAPEGYVLQIDEGYSLYKYFFGSGFNVFEGDVEDHVAANANLKTTLWSKLMTVVYAGDYCYPDLRISVHPNKEHNIVALDFDHGKVSVNPKSGKALMGDTVTLTTTFEEGYVADSMYVYWNDEDSHLLNIVGGTWYNFDTKFEMPYTDVYYKAVINPAEADIERDIFIPKTGSLKANVTKGIPHVLINDEPNGAFYDPYCNNADGSVTLTAYKDRVFWIRGMVTLIEGDSLFIYDGDNTEADTILKRSEGPGLDGLYTSGNSVTLQLKSDDKDVSYGVSVEAQIFEKTESTAFTLYENSVMKLARINGDYEGEGAIDIPEPIEVDYIDFDRKITPGEPVTVVLPFTLPKGTYLNATFFQLESVVQEDTAWKATMRWIGDGKLPKANTPYIVILDEGEDKLKFSFEDKKAIVQTGEIEVDYDTSKNWSIVGTYAYKEWDYDKNDDELGLVYAFAGTNEAEISKGQFGKIGNGAKAYPMRAYLKKKDGSVQLQMDRPRMAGEAYYIDFAGVGPEIESLDVDFVDQDEKPMAIGRMNAVTGQIKLDHWYDLKGRRTNSKPASKGAFFNKKVLVK